MSKPSKYKNVRTVVDGITFASKREAARYQELKLMERAGTICHLELQPKFKIKAKGKDICTYIADFNYWDCYTNTGQRIPDGRHIEDVKGVRTPVYKLKKKLVEALYDVIIEEV